MRNNKHWRLYNATHVDHMHHTRGVWGMWNATVWVRLSQMTWNGNVDRKEEENAHTKRSGCGWRRDYGAWFAVHQPSLITWILIRQPSPCQRLFCAHSLDKYHSLAWLRQWFHYLPGGIKKNWNSITTSPTTSTPIINLISLDDTQWAIKTQSSVYNIIGSQTI